MFIKSLSVAVASAALLISAGAQAAILGWTTPASFVSAATGSSAPLNQVADQVNWGAFDDSIGQPRNMGTINNGKQMTTALGETVTVTNSSSNQKAFTTYVEGGGTWNGNFVNGTTVLYNTNNVTTTLSFTNALSGLGVDLQTKLASASTYSFSISAYDASGNLLGTVTNNNGVSNGINAGTSHEGTVAFLGLTSNSANISYVTISSTNNTLGFAIDTSLIYHTNTTGSTSDPGQTTPEPGTLALLGAGLVALGAARRRRQRS
jgi:hypothetical protein